MDKKEKTAQEKKDLDYEEKERGILTGFRTGRKENLSFIFSHSCHPPRRERKG